MTDNSQVDIRWHGRGGQGAITAAKIVAKVAFDSGYGGVVMIPTFGTERRGAPVFTSLKLSKNPVHDLSPIEEPDIAVILDEQLITEADALHGIKPGGCVIINTPKPADMFKFENITTAVADISSMAESVGLHRDIVNTGIIGAFAKATGLLPIEPLLGAIEKKIGGSKGKANMEAARLAYDRTYIGEEK
ncbi:MAG: ketoisovalerate oxidoreductase [Deltaproteobacteria bacterium]|nr:MAG: ketoisovalerate oxidoreductase [Deltaproteobacteria bacterium]